MSLKIYLVRDDNSSEGYKDFTKTSILPGDTFSHIQKIGIKNDDTRFKYSNICLVSKPITNSGYELDVTYSFKENEGFVHSLNLEDGDYREPIFMYRRIEVSEAYEPLRIKDVSHNLYYVKDIAKEDIIIDSFLEGELKLLKVNDYGELVFPSQHDTAFYDGKLYATYMDKDQRLMMVKSQEGYVGWDIDKELTYVPSGSYNPSITFKDDGHYELALEIQPAGSDREIWLYSYPYSGSAIRKVAYGVNPHVATDSSDVTVIFYNNYTLNKTYYRREDEGFSTEHEITELPGTIDNAYEWSEMFESINQVDEEGYTYNVVVLADVSGELKYALDETFVNPIIRNEIKETTNVGVSTELNNIHWQEISELENESNETTTVGVSVEFNEIEWLEIPPIEESYDETTTVGVSTELNNIHWQEISELENESNETTTVGVSTELNNIHWQEISELENESNETTTVGVNAELKSILWIEEGE